jgi:putative transcriptional regulator
MIRHHPSDATLLAYAAATLPILHQDVLNLHLVQCPACRATVRLGQELGGVLLDGEGAAALADDALARALTQIDAPGSATPAPAPAPATPINIEALSQGRRWRRVGHGIRLIALVPRDASGTRLDLIRVAPGMALPEHNHTGPETTCVLTGGFADESGEYHAGDIAEGDVGLVHQPRALDRGECICLGATTGLLRARSLVVRVLQPIFGI